MAKRTPKSGADDAAAAVPASTTGSGRGRKGGTGDRAGQRVTADDPTVASAPTLDTTQAARTDPSEQRPPEDTIGADPRVTEANHVEQRGGPTDEHIRRRAYEIYLERGGQHGLDADDWYRAEHELRKRTEVD